MTVDDSASSAQEKSQKGNAKPYTIVTKCAAEFVAVMMFVTIGSLQALTTYDGVIHAALSHGVAIFILVSVFAHISGGHVNPAVTIGVAAAAKMRPIEAVFYIVAQLAGGIIGALIVRGLLAEIFTSFLLVQTVLITAVDGTTNFAPLSIGFTVLMDILAV
ncbi:transporter, major intrinsic protein family protein [Ancylostoma duodenale]|uniref:Transporter, major intrinsic protein family protein n=1 Tax=Ancylostoma duodenale TaxID=51022 RepID=A0A0C2GY15_9BILA|nr:transporter, major intrinsic protein family protein [Ancylostoma duodenale]